MPSPFPGMDPYLEDPATWRGVHHWLITAAAEQLQPQLHPRGYFVDVESRVWLEEPERAVYPDIALLQHQGTVRAAAEPASSTLLADEPVRVRVLEVEVREDYLQIYERDTRTLVTGIEFLSPSNKSDSQSRGLYIRKREEFRSAGVNLVEVDLLRAGKSLVHLPASVLHQLPAGGYVVNVVRAGSHEYEFYPITLTAPLPRVGIPLRTGEPDVVLDLQAGLGRVYEAGAYGSRIDYHRPPVPPLGDADTRWAETLLVDRGVRKASP